MITLLNLGSDVFIWFVKDFQVKIVLYQFKIDEFDNEGYLKLNKNVFRFDISMR